MPIPKLGSIKYKVKRGLSGFGLFSEQPVKRGEYIIEYTGKILRGKKIINNYPQNRYIFATSSVRMIDGSLRSNIARYINHSCKPNCKAEIIRGRIFIKATRRIEAGEEFTYDYGKEYTDEFIKPYGCRCVPCEKK